MNSRGDETSLWVPEGVKGGVTFSFHEGTGLNKTPAGVLLTVPKSCQEACSQFPSRAGSWALTHRLACRADGQPPLPGRHILSPPQDPGQPTRFCPQIVPYILRSELSSVTPAANGVSDILPLPQAPRTSGRQRQRRCRQCGIFAKGPKAFLLIFYGVFK